MGLYNKLMGTIGGILIGAMMLLIVTEVLSRLLVGRSIEGTVEIVGIFLALAVFFGFSPCEEEKSHVRVELLLRRLPDSFSFALNIGAYILAIFTVAVMAWQVGLNALSAWKVKEVLPGAKVQVPVYPAKAAAFVGYLAFCLQLCVSLFFMVRSRKGPRSHAPAEGVNLVPTEDEGP